MSAPSNTKAATAAGAWAMPSPGLTTPRSYPLSPALPLARPAADYASASIKRFIEHLPNTEEVRLTWP